MSLDESPGTYTPGNLPPRLSARAARAARPLIRALIALDSVRALASRPVYRSFPDLR